MAATATATTVIELLRPPMPFACPGDFEVAVPLIGPTHPPEMMAVAANVHII